jgi:hypothetical protein
VARIKVLGVRFSAAELVRIAAASEAAGLQPVAWIRHQALHAAQARPEPDPHGPGAPTLQPSGLLSRTTATRLTVDQFETLEERAQACGLPIAALIRKVLVGLNPVPRRPIVRAAIVAVNRVGNNLNQLVHLAHTGVVLAPEILGVLAEVKEQFKVLQDALIAADNDDHQAAEEPRE